MTEVEKQAWDEAVKYAVNELDKNEEDSKFDSTRYSFMFNEREYAPKRVYHHSWRFLKENYPDISIPNPGGGKPTNKFLRKLGYQVKNKLLERAIELYILHCKNTDWIKDEVYKFEWANWLNKKVDFNAQTDAEIYQLCIDSQKEEFTQSKGVQFIKQGAREKLSKYIGIDDIRNFREYQEGKELEDINFDLRNMSFPIISCYLSVFFPDDIYPASKTDFANSVRSIFGSKLSKSGIEFIEKMQPLMKEVEKELLKSQSIINLWSSALNKNDLNQLDKNWLVQDFFLFVSNNTNVLIDFNNDQDELIKVLKLYTSSIVSDYFEVLDIIKDNLNLYKDDGRFVTGLSKDRLNLTIGQRYCWNLYKSKKEVLYGVITTKRINNTTESFDGRPVAYYTSAENSTLANENIENVLDAISKELERTTKSGFEKHNNVAFEKAMFDLDYRDEVFEKAYGVRHYFLVGSYWDGKNPDQTDRFVEKGIWQNGYDDKFLDEVKSVSVGDHIAIKAAYTREKTKSVMLIKARGIVSENIGDGKNLKVNWEQHFEPFEVDFSGGYWATIKQVSNKEHIQAIWGTDMETGLKIKANKKTPINQILYGPPGTGKTYKLQNEYFSKYTISESSLTKEKYIETLVEPLTWWQTFAVALIDLGRSSTKDILDHEAVKAKELLSSAKSIKPILWSRLQAHCVKDCPNVNVTDRSDIQLFYKEEDSTWRVLEENLDEIYPEAKEINNLIKNFNPSTNKQIKNYEFITFHQSFSYEDFVEGIKPIMKEDETDLGYEIQSGVFKKLCNRAENDPDNNYAIFIDEINRGNVSAIFGELITLIEKDKRAGSKNALEVQLPYSKEKFSVPNNLHIYGTMNTADRSVEALDSALRRRFTFKELMPKPALLSDIVFDGFTLEEVLSTINKRIEILVDRDHTIGHSYFLSVKSGDTSALSLVFQDKIIPLLQEYFYHDYEKLALILGAGFVEESNNTSVAFANFKNIELPSIENQFTLIKNVENIEEAVLLLLNKEIAV